MKKSIMQTNKAWDIRWVPIPSPVKSVSSSNTTSKTSTADAIRALIAKKNSTTKK